jgi:predicted GIY-YIG superfamily endonuclease
VLRSDSDPERHYVGVTSDVDNRLEWHNHGPCGHTIEHRPWSLVVVIEFPSEEQALRLWMAAPPEPAPRTLSAPGASPTTPPI